MMNHTATEILMNKIKVTTRRHKYFIHMANEKRVVLTSRKAKALLEELTVLVNQHTDWLDEQIKSDDFEDAPLYSVSVFENPHDAEELDMLRAWLQDALLGWLFGSESHVAFLTRVRREAAESFAAFV